MLVRNCAIPSCLTTPDSNYIAPMISETTGTHAVSYGGGRSDLELWSNYLSTNSFMPAWGCLMLPD